MAAVIGRHDCHLYRNLYRKVCINRIQCMLSAQQSTATAVQTADEVQEVEYPDIKPIYPPGKWGDMEEWKCWHFHKKANDIQTIPNVKERLEKLAGSFNRRHTLLEPFTMWPGDIEYKQYLTKTHITEGLPEILQSNVDAELDVVRPLVLEAILQQEYKIQEADQSHKERAQSLMGHILSTVIARLSSENIHLMRSQFDEGVRVESWWKRLVKPDHEAFEKLPKDNIYMQKKRLWLEFMNVQSRHVAGFQIRTELPLPEFLPLDDKLCTEGSYPCVDFTPATFGVKTFRGRPISVSGHWIADPCEFGQLSVHVMPEKYDEFCEQFNETSIDELFTSYAMVSSFGWCAAQAHNQGFNLYMDLTYPLTTQTLVTDGKRIQLSAFQLNTLRLWQSDEVNERHNVHWTGTGPMQLYDSVQDGVVHGFNDDVLRILLQAMLLKPVDRGVDLRPYLPDEPSPILKRKFFNHIRQERFEVPKIGRFQYPARAVYF